MKNKKNLLKKLKSLTIINSLFLLIVLIGPNVSAPPGSFQATFMGYRSIESGGGVLYTQWSTGNLGNTWAEGEWVPYQAVLENVQVNYPGLIGMPDIEISYDFTNKGLRFADLIKGIQVGTTPLTDFQGWPKLDGSAYPTTTRAELETAQNSVEENVWIGFTFLNLPEMQFHRALDGTLGSPTDQFRKFVITPQDLINLGLVYENTIVIYFLLHESRTFIWQNSLQVGYNLAPTNVWGGYVYGNLPFSNDQRLGSGYVPGSSGHAQLEIAGAKTVPIPIPEQLPGEISGIKWLDYDMDGIIDVDEINLSGWRIFVSGTLESIYFGASTLTDSTGFYDFSYLTSGTIWTISEAEQRENPAETGYAQSYPYAGAADVGQATPAYIYEVGRSDWGWKVELTIDSWFQMDINFGNYPFSEAPILVDIDIKPGSYPNSINIRSKGVVAVAIITTDDFNASEVNPDTVYFLDALPVQWALEDVDDDSDLDMILHFKTQELDFSLLVDEGDEYPYAYLTGETISGDLIEGKDTVRLIGQTFLQQMFEWLIERFPFFEKILNQII